MTSIFSTVAKDVETAGADVAKAVDGLVAPAAKTVATTVAPTAAVVAPAVATATAPVTSAVGATVAAVVVPVATPTATAVGTSAGTAAGTASANSFITTIKNFLAKIPTAAKIGIGVAVVGAGYLVYRS